MAVVLLVSLVSTSCLGGSSDVTAPPPTPEREIEGLLPPTADVASPTQVVVAEPTVLDVPTAEPAPAMTLDCLSVRNRAALLLMPLLTQSELEQARVLAAAGELGGIALLGSPDANLAGDLQALQDSAKFASVLVASDEEGGAVQRLANLLGPLPSAATNATTSTPDDVRRQFTEYGSRALGLGVHVIFGPVLDVGGGPGIESRSFGDDPTVVTEFGAAVAEGLRQAGVLPVFKHFPGHGSATADSHLLLPTTPTLEELRARDLLPYVELLRDTSTHDDVAVMVGHLAVPGLSGDVPTSLSPEAINGLLRGDLGFTGIVFTDALNMGAIVDTYGPLEAIERSIIAGADIAILGSLADVSPALDYLIARAAEDANLAALIDNRAMRILISRGEGEICGGAR